MAKLPTVPQTQASNQSSFPGGEKKDFPTIPENTLLNVMVEDCKLKPLNPEFRAKFNIPEEVEVEFRFRVVDGKYAKRVLWGSAKPYWEGETSRLRLWTKEILGIYEFPAGYEFDTDDLVGLKCRILVANYPKRDGSTGEKVKDVLRAADPEEDF